MLHPLSLSPILNNESIGLFFGIMKGKATAGRNPPCEPPEGRFVFGLKVVVVTLTVLIGFGFGFIDVVVVLIVVVCLSLCP
jgi:hypothetical protein